jgi:hypothetical protein
MSVDRGSVSNPGVELRDLIRRESQKVSQKVDQVALGEVSDAGDGKTVGVLLDGFAAGELSATWSCPYTATVGQRVTVLMLKGGQSFYVVGVIDGPVAGAPDHGGLTGLGDDDHTHYWNDARGDAKITTHAGITSAHHSRYTDSEAVAAVHARYTDAEAVSAIGATGFAYLGSGGTLYADSNNALIGLNEIQAAAGSESDPSYTTTGDTDTGTFSPGADQWAVTVGAQRRFKVYDSPAAAERGAFDFTGDTNTDIIEFMFGGARRQLVNPLTGAMVFYLKDGGTSVLTLNDDRDIYGKGVVILTKSFSTSKIATGTTITTFTLPTVTGRSCMINVVGPCGFDVGAVAVSYTISGTGVGGNIGDRVYAHGGQFATASRWATCTLAGQTITIKANGTANAYYRGLVTVIQT